MHNAISHHRRADAKTVISSQVQNTVPYQLLWRKIIQSQLKPGQGQKLLHGKYAWQFLFASVLTLQITQSISCELLL